MTHCHCHCRWSILIPTKKAVIATFQDNNWHTKTPADFSDAEVVAVAALMEWVGLKRQPAIVGAV
jgi:hypothetical protein